VLILKRNATQDYLDFVTLAAHMRDSVAFALQSFDRLHPQSNSESPLQQLLVQLTNAPAYDLEKTEPSRCKSLDQRWHEWGAVKAACSHIAIVIFDRVCDWQANHSETTG
jgi:hypothetical protein